MRDCEQLITSGSIHNINALRQSVISDQFFCTVFLGMELLFSVYNYRVLLVKRPIFEACEQE